VDTTATVTSIASRPIRPSPGPLPSQDHEPRWSQQAGKADIGRRWASTTTQLAHFYEEIAALTGSHKVLPMNSGAEAGRRGAIKSVRKWGLRGQGRAQWAGEIIVCA